MDRIAVFVDAGYLFAEGSRLLTRSLRPRVDRQLKEAAAIGSLRATVQHQAPGVPLLRIYWYDGVPPRGMNPQQKTIADLPDVKMRLGLVNSQGEQKGVDSLIVADLIELGRNQAMSDALVMSGDVDVRIGVQMAQAFGVRVHLLCVASFRGTRSEQLLQESDTITEWNRATAESFLQITSLPSAPASEQVAAASSPLGTVHESVITDVEGCARGFVGLLTPEQRAELVLHCATTSAIPGNFDGRLLFRAKNILGRRLDEPEKRLLRATVIELIRKPPD